MTVRWRQAGHFGAWGTVRVVHDDYQPGSPEDSDRLYRNSYGRVLRTLMSVLRDRHAAEECAQEAFVRAFQAWPRWRPDAPAEAWVQRIALNVAVSHRRREALRTLAQTVMHLGRNGVSAVADAAAQRTELLGAMRPLPPQQAAVLVLRFSHGYSNREIAAALGAPESTIASRLSAAKARLRHELEGAVELVEAP